MKIKYKEIRFSSARRSVIAQAEEIINEYTAQGYELTLRQLYYQFVSRGLIENSQQEYKRLGDIINDARLAGLISWESITDRTRNLRGLSTWDGPADIIRSAAYSFRMDLWADQADRVEVWIEKDALVGVIEGVCNDLRVSYFSCRGYTSQSEMWVAAMRLRRYIKAGQTPHILHLGDHDPSGIDMSRDIQDRLELFMGAPCEFDRLALNMPQVQQYQPPPNPAKMTDTRCQGYIDRYGTESWELDALEPKVISALIRENVTKYRDEHKWKRALKVEASSRSLLESTSDRWEEVCDFLKQ